jgi:hypothetical protein
MGPRGQIVTGASVLLNRHVPTPKEIAKATPTTDSIHIFVDGLIPGTISMVAVNWRKRSVETAAEIQYVQERIRLPRSPLLLSDGMCVCITLQSEHSLNSNCGKGESQIAISIHVPTADLRARFRNLTGTGLKSSPEKGTPSSKSAGISWQPAWLMYQTR